MLGQFLEVGNAVVCHRDLFLQYRHPPGKIIVLAHLAGQLLDFGLRDRLADLQLVLNLVAEAFIAEVICNYDADQAKTCGN